MIRIEIPESTHNLDVGTHIIQIPITVTVEPGDTPGPPPPEAGSDELDLSTVKWLHTNVRGWPITSKVTETTIGAEKRVCIHHTKAGQWPVLSPGGVACEGNPWVFANIGGKWYGATYEWLRPGQVCKDVTRDGPGSIGAHTKVEPLKSWVPAHGEQIGLMVSTFARDNHRSSNERSNVVLTRWP